jgi:ribonuclease HII
VAKLIIAVDVVGVRAVAGPVVGAAVLFDATARETRFEVHDPRRGVQRYTLADPKKIPTSLLPHIVTHIKKTALSYATVQLPASEVSQGRDAAWLTMGRAAARCAERATHLASDSVRVGSEHLEIYIPTGGHCPYALVGRIGQRPMSTDWRRGAAYVLARVAHMDTMTRLHEQYPEYGFAVNQGNLTQDHKKALRRHGATAEHRGLK